MNQLFNSKLFAVAALVAVSLFPISGFGQQAADPQDDSFDVVVAGCVAANRPDLEPCKTIHNWFESLRKAHIAPLQPDPLTKPIKEIYEQFKKLIHEKPSVVVEIHKTEKSAHLFEEELRTAKNLHNEAPEGGIYDAEAGVCVAKTKIQAN
ncbi:MAG: hypothetical protein HY074_03855 [Deltaproteobacteria bacterium]|nr:hypothetical protein [Deltaproteobacteria bacterium]